jgi:hypothetical protein
MIAKTALEFLIRKHNGPLFEHSYRNLTETYQMDARLPRSRKRQA